MTTTRRAGTRHGMLPVALLALLAAGCGTQRAAGTVEAQGSPQPTPSTSTTPTARATPSTPTDFLCPGETSLPTPPPTAHPPARPGDHYAENHGFRIPFTLHGQSRCDGLAAIARVKAALGALRERGDFAADHAHSALTELGYPADQVRTLQLGPDGVGFRIKADTSPLICVKGTMGPTSFEAEAFGGFPDHPGCDTPSGGH